MVKGRIFRMFIFLSILLFTSGSNQVIALENIDVEQPKVLVIYSSKTGEIDEYQRILDLLLGHFTTKLTFKSSHEVEMKDFEQADYLFYYGQEKERLPKTMVDLVADYDGVVVAIGYNVEQLGERFSFIEWMPNPTVISQVHKTKDSKELSFVPQYAIHIHLIENDRTEVLLWGEREGEQHPIFVKNDTNYYFASHLLRPPFAIMFGEVLHEVFEQSGIHHSEQHVGYIRLEDIHPLVDPDTMMFIADTLKEKNIPYMIAVIPVYTNPETKKQYHLEDFPKLIRALKYMQDNGGSIVLHGYTHQFRLSETGEGFEFWDVENNMPIYHGPDDEVVIRTMDDFESAEAYEQYLLEQKAYERKYIEERLQKGIHELSNYGLYPLAFEAPHYTISQHGYQIISEYFTHYAGQVQLSDQNWEIMTTAPYITKPNLFHGTELLPETLGYVVPEDPQAIDKMMDNAKDYQFVRDGMVAGFFHPYLGTDTFLQFIERIGELDSVSWIDLKQRDVRVHTDLVDIRTVNGEVLVETKHVSLFMTSLAYLGYHVKNVVTVILWGIATISIFAVLTFIVCMMINLKNQAKWGKPVG